MGMDTHKPFFLLKSKTSELQSNTRNENSFRALVSNLFLIGLASPSQNPAGVNSC